MNKYHISFKVILLAFSVVFTAGCEPDSPIPDVTFLKKNSIPGNGRASAVSFSVNGKGYVALGRNGNKIQLSDCWEYDPGTDSWQEKSPFPGTPRVKASATVLNGKVYIGLGHNNEISVYNTDACLKDFWEYTPETDSWKRLADFPSNFTNACVSFARDGGIYTCSGFSEAGMGDELWKYVPAENKWYKMKDFPGKARFGGTACSDGHHIFFGTGFRNGNWNDWWEYNDESDSWKKLRSIPDNGRVNAVSLTIGNRYYVATGRHFGGNLTGGHVKADLMEYNPDENSWQIKGELPEGKRENAVAFVINGIGYIGFGDNDEKVLNDFWSFKP